MNSQRRMVSYIVGHCLHRTMQMAPSEHRLSARLQKLFKVGIEFKSSSKASKLSLSNSFDNENRLWKINAVFCQTASFDLKPQGWSSSREIERRTECGVIHKKWLILTKKSTELKMTLNGMPGWARRERELVKCSTLKLSDGDNLRSSQ